MEHHRTQSGESLRHLPLHERYVALGVTMLERDGWLLPRSFQSHEREILLLREGKAFLDISDSGILKIGGAEVVEWIHRITSKDFREFKEGSVRQTLLLTEKGRVIDSLLVLSKENHVFVVTSRGSSQKVARWLEKYIIMEDIGISDETGEHVLFLRLSTEKSPDIAPPGASEWSDYRGSFFGMNAGVLLDGEEGYADSVQIGIDAFESFRIARGIPAFGKELTEEFNPLELGLRGQISFQKGCYVGQEVIARLDTYDKVQRALCRVRISGAIVFPERAFLLKNGEKIGMVTSQQADATNSFFSAGLAVIRKGDAGVGNGFAVDGMETTVTVEQVFEH